MTTSARFFQPTDIAVDAADNLYVADSGNHAIRLFDVAGNVITIGGDKPLLAGGSGPKAGFQDGVPALARFDTPSGVAVDTAGDVYVADTGRTRVVPDPATGRMIRGPSGTVGQADNGRIFRFEFNKNNPRKVDSFSVFADGDAPSSPEFVAMINPDNIETSMYSLMVQEDTEDARIWNRNLATGTWSVVARVNDPNGESSGIVDASEWFGSGAWILDVQGHGQDVLSEFDPDTGVTSKLESGQLLLMSIPGT